MPRTRTSRNTADDLKDRTRKLFARSPLSAFLPLLEDTITSVAGTTDPTGKRGLQALVRMVDYYERLFLNGFGTRFHLDAWFSDDICGQWSTSTIQLPRQIVPIYGDSWGYSLLPCPWASTNPLPIYAICFPGRSERADVNLLEYAWLCHELGHHLLLKLGTVFAANFKVHLTYVTKGILRRAVADSPNLRSRTTDLVADLQKVWSPTPNTCDWAHEIAADAIALWTCGPAFLTAMEHVVENETIQPYEISENHPPYELRLRMLVDLADNLEWGEKSSALKSTLNRWQTGNLVADMNTYSALADGALAEECRSQILKACRSWNLPQCTSEVIRETQQKTEAGDDPKSAIEFILAAWCVYQKDPDASHAWESGVLARLSSELDGDT